MKKIKVLNICIIIFLLFLLTSCRKTCDHPKTIIEEVPSTCITEGYIISYCEICNKEYKTKLPLGYHTLLEKEVVTPLTYTQNERRSYICSVCNKEEVSVTTFNEITNRNVVLKEFDKDDIYVSSINELLIVIDHALMNNVQTFTVSCDLPNEFLLDKHLLSYMVNNNISFNTTIKEVTNGFEFTFDYKAEPSKTTASIDIEKFNNLNLQEKTKTRSDDFNDFAIENVEESLVVESTEQLSSCLMKGIRPICSANSNAYRIYEVMKDILRKIIHDDMSAFEKVLAIHDYLCSNVNYDYDLYEQGLNPLDYQSGWLEGIFEDKQGVCSSLANAFTSLCNIEGIICLTVTGISKENNKIGHAWNKVYLDSNWYIVDLTGDIMPLTLRTTKEVTLYQSFLTDETYYTTNYDIYTFNKIRCNKNYNKYTMMKYTYQGVENDFVIDSFEELLNVVSYLENTYSYNATISILMNYDYDSFDDELSKAYDALNITNDSVYYSSVDDEYIIAN